MGALLDTVTSYAHKPLLVAGLALPTTRLQRVTILLIILVAEWYNYAMILNKPGRKGISDCFGAIAIPSRLMVTFDWLFLTPDPRTSLRPVPSHDYSKSRHATNGGIDKSNTSAQRSFWRSNLWWAINIANNPRAIGTAAQITVIPPLSPKLAISRRNFCLWRLFYGALAILRLGASYYFVTHSQSLKQLVFATEWTILGRVLNTILVIHMVYCILSGPHALFSAVAVAAGLHEPEDWPDMFGDLWDAYSVSRAWGYVILNLHLRYTQSAYIVSRFWHQSFRKVCR